MATSCPCSLPLDPACALGEASCPQEMDSDLNTTPERDEEGKRRRLSSEACLAAAPSSTTAATAAGGPAAAAAADEEEGGFTRRDSCQSTATTCGPCGSSPQPPPLTQAVEDMLRRYLLRWGQRLVDLQPKVYMTEHLTECGLYLFRYLRQLQVEACCQGQFPLEYLSNERLLIHDLVSCWWIALKHCSIRTAVPNRTLMCRATGACPELLADRELAALVAVDWEVQAVLKQGGLVL